MIQHRSARIARCRWPGWILPLTVPGLLLARQGLVTTRDGTNYQGQVRTETNRIIIANAQKGYTALVELTNLLAMSFRVEPQPPQLIGALAATHAGIREGVLPAPWRSQDIGYLGPAGRATLASGILRVRSAGTQIAEERDSFHFVFTPIAGNSEVMARVIGVSLADPSAKAGVMLRASLDADAPHVMLALTASRGGVLQWRESPGGPTLQSPQRDLPLPGWVRLKRYGNTIASYKSRNGRDWRLAHTLQWALPDELWAGVAVASGHPYRETDAILDQVRAAPSLPLSAFIPQIRLRSGSTVAGRIVTADVTVVTVSQASGALAIPTPQVANLLFEWVPARLMPVLTLGRSGVLLRGGEFVDGEFRGVETDRVSLSSVLFGHSSFDVNSEVLAVVLRAARAAPQSVEIRTIDGSIWRGSDLELGWNEIIFLEPVLGRRHILIADLKDLRRRP